MASDNSKLSKRKKTEDMENEKEEDPDKYCRLRHGLNVHCLAEIFKYLDCPDLLTLGEMNDYYKQIVHELVIPNFKVQVCLRHEATVQNIWKRHSKQIRRFQFAGGLSDCEDFLNEIVQKHCHRNQLKEVEFYMNETNNINNNIIVFYYDDNFVYRAFCIIDLFYFVDRFRKVNTFSIRNLQLDNVLHRTITFQNFKALRVLRLYNVQINSDFDWTYELLNLTELELVKVFGINEQRFDEFIVQRPKLERFLHMHTFENIRAIGNKMAIYCDKMQSFHDLVDNDSFYHWDSVDSEKKYNFLGDFKHLKEVSMSPKRLCPCDITQALALLAENDTLEKLSIFLTALDDGMRDCYSYQINMKPFTQLKTIRIHWRNIVNRPLKEYPYSATFCEHMKLFTDFSSQLLANVDTIIMSGNGYPPKDITFLENALKLRTLSIYNMTDPLVTSSIFWTFSIISNILEKRRNGRFEGKSSIDFIEMIVNLDQWSRFKDIENVDNFIKFKIQRANPCELPMCDKYYDPRMIDKNVDPVFPHRYK